MGDPVARVPAPREAADDRIDRGQDGPSIPLAELTAWHRPGVHRVRLAGREVWVRMDERGIASISSVGPERLADRPLG